MEENIDYNAIPVYYCKDCLSLNIKGDGPIDYCDTCSSTEVGQCSLEEYDEFYYKKHGEKYFYK